MQVRDKKSGFTIVELLIVIVIIAILAAITIVAYNGIQQRTRDTIRVQDVSTIRKALELYKATNLRYPDAAPNPGISSWEISTDTTFMNTLSNDIKTIPRDPKNNAESYYAYYRYVAGSHGCPASAGAFYVLRITQLESQDGRTISDLAQCRGVTHSGTRAPTQTHAVFFGFEN